jgi:hypothetical protein
VETTALGTRRLGVELSTWTDPGDTAWLLVEPAYSPTSRRDGLILGLAHHRLAIRPALRRPVVTSPASLTAAQQQWAARRAQQARKQRRADVLAWVWTAVAFLACAGAVLLCWRAGGWLGAVAGAASIGFIALLLERWAEGRR